MPLLIDSMSIGLRSVIDSSLLLFVAFVFIVILSVLLMSGKGGGGGGMGTFEVTLEGGAGGGGGGGGGRAGAEVIVGGGGLDGIALCAGKLVDGVFKGALEGRLGGRLCDAEDILRRFGGKGGALRVWCWNRCIVFINVTPFVFYIKSKIIKINN